jgi:hypothetical protein
MNTTTTLTRATIASSLMSYNNNSHAINSNSKNSVLTPTSLNKESNLTYPEEYHNKIENTCLTEINDTSLPRHEIIDGFDTSLPRHEIMECFDTSFVTSIDNSIDFDANDSFDDTELDIYTKVETTLQRSSQDSINDTQLELITPVSNDIESESILNSLNNLQIIENIPQSLNQTRSISLSSNLHTESILQLLSSNNINSESVSQSLSNIHTVAISQSSSIIPTEAVLQSSSKILNNGTLSKSTSLNHCIPQILNSVTSDLILDTAEVGNILEKSLSSQANTQLEENGISQNLSESLSTQLPLQIEEKGIPRHILENPALSHLLSQTGEKGISQHILEDTPSPHKTSHKIEETIRIQRIRDKKHSLVKSTSTQSLQSYSSNQSGTSSNGSLPRKEVLVGTPVKEGSFLNALITSRTCELHAHV